MYHKIGFGIVSLFLLSGCTGKQMIQEKNQESALITLKTPAMGYSDQGFIYKGSDFLKVEIYSMGQALVSFDINSVNICMSLFECMSKEQFNSKILSPAYPPTLLENIFNAQPIFQGLNLVKNSNGFTQTIKKEGAYNITYSVVSDERIFRDTINKILIKVRPQ